MAERKRRELTVDELDVEGMVVNVHFRMGEAYALLGGIGGGTPRERVDRANELAPKLLELLPFMKALGRLAQEQPGRTQQLWAEALREPMPFGMPPVGMPTVEEEPADG